MITQAQRLLNLEVPKGPIDVVLDTDTYNEIDDQFAIAYLLRSGYKLHTQALYAAPYFNAKSTGPADGMEKSYQEILKLLDFLGEDKPVFRGSPSYLVDEKTPVVSDAARDLAERAMQYSPEHPLYVVAIGAITNVASAVLLNPAVADHCVLVWLGGHSLDYHDTREFNMQQDVAAARVVMSCGIPFVQLPCFGVVSSFTVSKQELETYFLGKNPTATYLAQNTIEEAESYAAGRAWTRVIWDVTGIAWLLNDDDRFMLSRIEHTPIPSYDHHYTLRTDTDLMRYVYYIKRDALLNHLIDTVCR